MRLAAKAEPRHHGQVMRMLKELDLLAPLVQRPERSSPKAKTQVRVLQGVP